MATSLLLLLIALSPFSALADVSWNIDCGASDSHYDDDQVWWEGDDTLISAGQSRTVQNADNGHAVDTLRVFTSGKKNCYVLEGKKGAKLLVRASFFYGNYDRKSSPPTFDIQIDGNNWVTVKNDMESNTYYEVIYIGKGDSISLCLLQTKPNQYPFISAIEVRTLDSEMYKYLNADQALSHAGWRRAFGADDSITDRYDRLWKPSIPTGAQYTSVAGTAFIIDTTTADANPPEEAVMNAMTTSDSSAQIMKLALTDYLDSTPSLVYLNLYFSEVSELDVADNRSFTIYFDDKLVGSTKDGISPPYRSVAEVPVSNVVASNSSTITLQSSSNSTLPPIINAIEVFQVINYTVYSVAKGPSGSGGSTPSDTKTSTSSSRKKKSSLPLILGAGIPGFLLFVAFVVVVTSLQQKRQRAAMAAATTGASNGQRAASNNKDIDGGIVMGTNFGQEVMNEFEVNVEDRTTDHEDPNNQLPYGSPAPLLNQTR